MSDLYAVGDVHGCLESLKKLLEKLPENARLIFLGDIVNRGPESLETLRLVKSLCEEGRAKCLLGNHDLHLLAVAAGHGSLHRRDTIGEILEAPDRAELISWLRHQNIALFEENTLFVHAGVHPSWDLETAMQLAAEAEKQLSGRRWKSYLRDMYGPDQWEETLEGQARMRAVFNAFTRIRFISRTTGKLDFDVKEGLAAASPDLIPWFDDRNRALRGQTIVFGHWSMLGLLLRPDIIAADTGCLWGGSLTAVRISDRRAFMQRCPLWRSPV